MRKEIVLDGADWKMNRFSPGQGEKEGAHEGADFWDFVWMKADVPGDVHSTLLKNGAIPDPYFGRENEKCKWIADCEWWFRKGFRTPEEFKNKKARIIFEGVDYRARFWLNGKYLGEHEGMFSPVVFEVKNIEGANTLAVCILPPPRNRAMIGGMKCNLGYGIDYTPEMITMGIWRSVKVIFTDDLYIENVHIIPEVKGNSAKLKMNISLLNSSDIEKTARVCIKVSGENFSSRVYEAQTETFLKPDGNTVPLDVNIPDPKLWWPWDMGEQNLYKVEVSIHDGATLSDEISVITGIREVKMLRNPDTPEDGFNWTFSINGKREYIRGACWTNTDILLGELKKEKYEKALALVKSSNMNMLRIHGWHLIETPDFYDICNRMGILVWQEFAFCNLNYPQTEEFLKKVEGECTKSIKEIRNHPSLVVWCGGNEYNYKRNKKLIDFLGRICKENDPTRWFIPESDLNRHYYLDKHFNTPAERPHWEEKSGDYHNWQVWHGFCPISEYSKDKCLFASEFGLQSVPDIDSLKKFIPKDELWPPGPSWEYHFIDMKKLEHYAYQITPKEKIKSLEDFVEASQIAQANALKYAIEHYRRRKYRNSGSIFWQFNEPWPAIVWSVVDWYLKPKLAYYTVKNSYSPVLVSVQYEKEKWIKGEMFKVFLWVINDYHRSFKDCRIRIDITDMKRRKYQQFFIDVDIPKDSAKNIKKLEWKVPEDVKGVFMLRVYLKNRDNVTISENDYIFKCE